MQITELLTVNAAVTHSYVVLVGVLVNVLIIGPKGRGSNPAKALNF
jgi:hypothetical protein